MEITRENAIMIVLEEIDIITNEQIKIIKYNDELEDRRLRLLEFLQRSRNLNISKEAQRNLLLNVSHMKLNVVRAPENFKDKVMDVILKKKCRYDDKGYCKYQKKCKFQHSGKTCDQFLKDGKCDSGQSCQDRHPKDCKFWQRDTGGCKRDQLCKYLHKCFKSNGKAEENSEIEGMDTENVDQNEDAISAQKIKQLEEELLSQNATLNQQKEIEAKLTAENSIIKGQLERLQRVVTNMSKEINNLKSTRS